MEEKVYYHNLNLPTVNGCDLIYLSPGEASWIRKGDVIKIGDKSVALAEVQDVYAVARVKRGKIIKQDRGYLEIHDKEHINYEPGCPFCSKRAGEW
jgi:hypothetical protein